MNYNEFKKQLQDYLLSRNLDILNYNQDSKNKTLNEITSYVKKGNYTITDKVFTEEELITSIYNDLVEFSFLTKYLNDDEVEEISINSYDNILIKKKGKKLVVQESFSSPENAIDTIKRMLQHSNEVIDRNNQKKVVSLDNNIRVSVAISPMVSEKDGVVASIRKVHTKSISKDFFLSKNSATKEMLDIIEVLTKYGVSQIYAGATGSGKTTFLGYAGQCIQINKDIVILEQGTQELVFDKAYKLPEGITKQDIKTFEVCSENEIALNEKRYTITSNDIVFSSRNDIRNNNSLQLVSSSRYFGTTKNTSLENLVEHAMTNNPDVIVVGEMKSIEAFNTLQAGNTGHQIMTSIHTNNVREIPSRITSLILNNKNIDTAHLERQVYLVFGLAIYMKEFSDGSRRISELAEFLDNGTINTLYRYENKAFKKVNSISEGLKKHLVNEKNITDEDLNKLI